MNKPEILRQVEVLFRNTLDEEDIILAETSTANDVEGWDSLTHIQLVVAIEKHFGIKFLSREILEWKNVGDMIDSIENKILNK
jgi:acyl carrier protein